MDLSDLKFLVPWLLVPLLASPSGWAQPRSEGAIAARAGAADGQDSWRVDHERSSVLAVTGKSGMLGFLGHRHAVLATEWTAEIEYDPDRPEATRVDVTIPVTALEIDSARALGLAGLDPDGGPSAGDVTEIAARMAGPDFLAAEEHPQITFETVAARWAEGYDRLVVGGPLTIRGRSDDVNVPLTVEPEPGGYRVTGELPVRMTDFGMEPESVAGVVKVADEVDIRLDIRVTRDPRP